MVTNSQSDDLSARIKKDLEEIERKTQENLRVDSSLTNEDSTVSSSNTDADISSPAETQTSTEDINDTDTNTANNVNTLQDEQQEPPSQPREPERIPDGVSRAYDEVPVEGFDVKAPKDKKEKNVVSKGSITPPKRDRGGTKGKSGGDNIMEVFWNDCIMAFYAWGIDAIVDNTLDFAEWVLFAPYKSGGKVDEKEEKAKKNIYMVGDEFYKERAERFSKEKAKLIELNENIAKKRDGIAPSWVLWEREPNFYKKLCQIQEKADEDPSSPEAEFMQKYGLGVNKEVIEGRFSKEEKIFTLATRLATIEEVIRGEKDTISPEFSNKLEELESKLKEKNTNVEQLKTIVSAYVSSLQEEVGGEEKACTEINKKLEEISQITNSGTKASAITKDVSRKIKEIKTISKDAVENEEIIKTHIQKRSQQHYKKIMENIDKIHEVYADNPEKIQENIKNYLTSVNNAGKNAKKETDTIITKNINDRSKHKKAKEAVAQISKTIEDYMLEGTKISERAPATQKDEFTLTEKQFSKAIREYRLGR